MKPLTALFRQTWWLWLGCAVAVAAMVRYLDPFFLVLAPMLTVVFVYFAYMRFDSAGRPREV
ncbi:MAG: hypothetical protein AAF790_14605 [Planctomycetota bacterium]